MYWTFGVMLVASGILMMPYGYIVLENPDGTRSAMTLPGHRTLQSSTLRAAPMRAGIARDDFRREYDRA